jgi:hypothetical protein
MQYESTYGSDAVDMGYTSAGHRFRYCHDILTEMERRERIELRQQRNWLWGFVCLLGVVSLVAGGL